MSKAGVFLRAPAKVNWTLEVLSQRSDGYHEVRTILQTLWTQDELALDLADEIGLSVRGVTNGLRAAPPHIRRWARQIEVPESNLAYHAACLLRTRARYRGGAQIRLRKRIPLAAGLGGGSSDAAATLLGLRHLWRLDISGEELVAIAAELGSDVPFFLRGGTALASGRGERIEPLPDAAKQRLVIAWPKPAHRIPNKTARMYAALRPEHYTDGSRTERLAERLRAGKPVRDEDVFNVFEGVLPEVDPPAAELFERAATFGIGQPHLAGAGPAFFFLTQVQLAEPLLDAFDRLGLQAGQTETLPAAGAVVVTSTE